MSSAAVLSNQLSFALPEASHSKVQSRLGAFRSSIAGDVLTPSSGEAYTASIGRWAGNAVQYPAYVVCPKTEQDVSLALKFADSLKLDLSIKSGAHFFASSSEGGLVVDLSKYMSGVQVDQTAKTATVGAGANWEAVDKAAIKYGLATVAGTANFIGVGGLTVGGGYGWLSGKHGLAIDNLLEATVVVADGRVLVASEKQNSDLFWGIRGGGSNFGVVTSFTFRLHSQRSHVYAGSLHFAPHQLPALVDAINKWYPTISEDEGGALAVCGSDEAAAHGFTWYFFHNGSEEAGQKAFRPFFKAGPAKVHAGEMPYENLNGMLNSNLSHGDRKFGKGATFSFPCQLEMVQSVYDSLHTAYQENKDFAQSHVSIEFLPLDKICSVDPSSTAFGNRGKFGNVNIVYWWKMASLDEVAMDKARSLAASLQESQGQTSFYANYSADSADKAAQVFGANYERMREVKAKYDPKLRFNKWFPVQPAA